MKKRKEPLLPAHPAQFRRKGPPFGMSTVNVDSATSRFLESEALDIFTICANAGKPFSECLSAVFISGINLGVNRDSLHKDH